MAERHTGWSNKLQINCLKFQCKHKQKVGSKKAKGWFKESVASNPKKIQIQILRFNLTHHFTIAQKNTGYKHSFEHTNDEVEEEEDKIQDSHGSKGGKAERMIRWG